MHGFNSISSLKGAVAVFILPLDNGNNSVTSKSSKALLEVIDQLAKSLSKDGKLDDSSVLGKMLAKAMAANGKTGDGIESIKDALEKLIHDKLGDNFGASAGIGAGAGSGNNGTSSGVSEGDGAGQSDLMTQVLNGLCKSMLDELLTPEKNGASFSKDDMPMLDKIAQFMDDNQAQFPPPKSGSWKNEFAQDTHLNNQDTATLRSALDILSKVLGKQESDSSAADGGLGSPVSDVGNAAVSLDDSDVDANPIPQGGGSDDLGQLLGELEERGLQSVLSGGGLGTPIITLAKPDKTPGNEAPSHDLGQLLGGLIEKGIKATLQESAGKNGGNNLQASAEQTVALIINTLLPDSNSPAAS